MTEPGTLTRATKSNSGGAPCFVTPGHEARANVDRDEFRAVVTRPVSFF